ncbi:MAG: hypothetical protein K6E61_08155 [Bacteroidales bacterium]|nr:hypothetical protein [Bacteroidales bacterium]
MKTKYLFIALGALSVLGACQKDPWAAVEKGSWNSDHRILDIKFAGQAGKAVVKDIDETTGTVTLQLATDLVTDMSKVTVETLELSYKATSSVERGGTIDFTAASPSITVTASTGQSRTYALNMTEFTETIIGKYRITDSKVWGGTGPEWGGGALMSPENKPWCWYVDEGFGPAAEYDDYLEFTLDEIMSDGNTTGKCIHYGGVDGKHWNCLFKAAVNKEGTTDIDLHKFYRQIPVGTSTWVRNYTDDTITFTDERGTVTIGRILPSGTYNLYKDDSRDVNLTVEKMAFAFQLSGVDDWTNIYSDYDKFAKRPRLYFILSEPVSSIPAESATQGTEGKNTVEPPAPAPVFELPGSWMVKELWVYGGAVDRITKDQAPAKSWCWNNCNAEMDNILVFTPSGEGSLSGTLNYTAGADGAYWDYMYVGKKAGVEQNIDCSEWYGWLPHTETSYKYNPDDTELSEGGSVTIKKTSVLSYNVPLLLPGNYDFLGKSTLTIADGCMALALPLADAPSLDTSFEWTDYDRFVNSPLLYVMVFQKQVLE